MNIRKYSYAIVFALVALCACKKDDDGGDVVTVPPRDRGEQQQTDDAMLQEYLKTHFYKVEKVFLDNDTVAEYEIAKLDTIAGDNSAEMPIIESNLLTTKKITRDGVEYKLYVLKLNEGAGSHKPTYADSTLVTYRGELLYNDDALFDSAITYHWFDQASPSGAVIEGWREALIDFRGASGVKKISNDGIPLYENDYGHAVLFIPSGLGYFNRTQPGIPAYSPLIFNIQLFDVNQSDHDADGIPSYLEDLDGDRLVLDADDDTDENLSPNYVDNDDDGDGVLTRDEITSVDVNEDGVITLDEITFYDDDGDGIKNHLDFDDREKKND
ncbi:FKBP-type peptidyl-prolyl cis-trans isomerase [Aquimarina aquimarini]|uniref:FKBP-type peptidyl-prolyl cis-trans isomerase n=1 Tax=Aquimarina aquimarini TaxID=1191734 RepID=UPI000D55FDC6|nr:FKBP-type peptidyl-prolyl cis-trans isomerase [Aquimarina aquimarini]